MADYIAKERAFHRGRMIEKGAPVSFEDDADVPAWAGKPEDIKPEGKAAKGKADTRPDDAIAASKAKRAGMSGDA